MNGEDVSVGCVLNRELVGSPSDCLETIYYLSIFVSLTHCANMDFKAHYHYDDYIDRAHARSTTIENGYLPCARAWSSQCGIAIVRAQI